MDQPEKHVEGTSFSLSDRDLSLLDLERLSGVMTRINLEPKSWEAIRESRARLLKAMESGEAQVQGMNRGFGWMNSEKVEAKSNLDFQMETLRANIVSYGKPVPDEVARAMMALKIHELAKGFSGVSEETVKRLIDLFNWPVIPYIPVQGDFGGSDHSNSLAYLIYGLTGHGKVFGENGKPVLASEFFKKHGIEGLQLREYELPQLISGNQAAKALGMDLLVRAQNINGIADDVFSLSFEVLNGCHYAFEEKIHEARHQVGQLETCHNVCSKIKENGEPSELNKSLKTIKNVVQDAYTLRCCCQVHGVLKDALRFFRDVYEKELNSVSHTPFVTKSGKIISNGNFTAVYSSKIYDFLSLSVHEIGSFSERRTQRLISPILNVLTNPAHTTLRKSDSTYIMLHRMASTLVAESKTLCYPSSVDSIPTYANQEDFNSNAVNVALRLEQIINNVERILGIELMASVASLGMMRPRKTTPYLEKFQSAFEKAVDVLQASDISEEVEKSREFIYSYYRSSSGCV